MPIAMHHDFNCITGQRIGPFDEHGNTVKRTKQTHPYSYDGFVQWKCKNNVKANDTIYSDRLLQWDFDKHDRLCKKHFGNTGQWWDRRDCDKIEAFLRDWTEDQSLTLTLIMEYCNVSNGYPCWRFDFLRTGNKSEQSKTLDKQK